MSSESSGNTGLNEERVIDDGDKGPPPVISTDSGVGDEGIQGDCDAPAETPSTVC